MAAIKNFVVNGKTYKVQMLSVMDTIDLHIETLSSLGGFLGQAISLIIDAKKGKELSSRDFSLLFKDVSPDGIKKLKTKVFAQIVTPENKFLTDEMEVENWFCRDDNRKDVWEVLVKGSVELLGEFAPSFLTKMAEEGMEKVSDDKSQSQKNTEQRQ